MHLRCVQYMRASSRAEFVYHFLPQCGRRCLFITHLRHDWHPRRSPEPACLRSTARTSAQRTPVCKRSIGLSSQCSRSFHYDTPPLLVEACVYQVPDRACLAGSVSSTHISTMRAFTRAVVANKICCYIALPLLTRSLRLCAVVRLDLLATNDGVHVGTARARYRARPVGTHLRS